MDTNDQLLILTRAIGLNGQPRIDVTLSGDIAHPLAHDIVNTLRANPRAVARIAAACAPQATRADHEAAVTALMAILLDQHIELDAIEAEDLALDLRDHCGPASDHELARLQEAS